MTDIIGNVRSNFFGKDSLVPFIGQVEDVNDPKMSHRVKVRCVGWHPKEKSGENGLPTDDLPWARVGMPTTHAQTSRIGGKHGLLPGSWVFGFFIDGDEANDPFILSTFNMTAKAATKDIREKSVVEDGKITDSADGFTNVNSEQDNTNTELRTTKEQNQNQSTSDTNDAAAATNLSDSDATKCGGKKPLQSVASERTESEMRTSTNSQGQNITNTGADGQCGSIPNAQSDTQITIQEQLPSQLDRFKYGDMVWENFSGNYMDLNGIMSRISVEISNNTKSLLNSTKAVTNELDRIKHSTTMLVPDRVGFVTEAVDVAQQTIGDVFNGIYQVSFVDTLMPLVMGMVQGMDNQANKEETGNNLTGDIGASPNTSIMNTASKTISATLMNNLNTISINVTEIAGLSAMKFIEEEQDEEGEGESLITQIIDSISPVLQFPLMQKYAQLGGVFNKAGDKSQSKTTKGSGCREERIYNTETGNSGTSAGTQTSEGGNSGSTISVTNKQGSVTYPNGPSTIGGSSGYGSSERSGRNRLTDIGFGGLNINDITNLNTNILEEESRIIVIKDPGVDAGFIEVPNPLAPGNIIVPNAKEVTKPDSQILDYIKKGVKFKTIPAGERGRLASVSQASVDENSARNFVRGVPNQIIVVSPGERYFFNNLSRPENTFPSLYIKGYRGTPVPVVDKKTGEMVAVLTNPKVWDPELSGASVSLIPDDSGIGITTDDPDYDVVLGGFFVSNTGKNYKNPTIEIIDKDKNVTNGEASLVVVSGRIVDAEIINNGSGFLRIPQIKIRDTSNSGAFGAKLYPIMSVIPRPQAKPLPIPVQMIACPTKNQTNLY